MEKDYKRYLRAVLVIILTVFCTMKLPHTDQSIFQFILPPIKIGAGSRLYLSGLLTIIPLFWSYREIVKSHYFDANRFMIFAVMFLVVVPILFKGVNIIKTPYYTFNKGLRTIEIVDSKLDFDLNSEPNKISLDLKLKNYSNDEKEFNILLVLPESLKGVLANDTYALSERHSIGPYNQLHINELIEYYYGDGFTKDDIYSSHFFYDSYAIILLNDDKELIVRLKDGI